MTTTTKNLSNQRSNYAPLEAPIKELRKVIDDYKSKIGSTPDFETIENVFAEVEKIIFPKK
ncbi:MAG: hypothetical protein OJF59_001878 [Cytophagales bacterium]|jgi:preprotein translocase subunit SecE|nr:MAG: hypothetical protein OJF59_001878 [Cytophagales bacterium]